LRIPQKSLKEVWKEREKETDELLRRRIHGEKRKEGKEEI